MMGQDARDEDQLYVILRYCERLLGTVKFFGRDYATFCNSAPYQDACALCLIQTGEAVNRLSNEFREAHPQIEWSKIYGMRNHLVHGHDMFDCEIAWDAIENYVPPLREFCEERIAD